MNSEKHDEVYEGKVLQFRKDKRVSEDMAIGIRGVGTYSYLPRNRKTRVTPVPSVPTDGGDAA